ncbi:protein saal1 isoform X1 [Xenopus laevis]|uniref:Protein saal1 isoform X1 n=1 Tax=Xenopus laevis TaxID=8355 RepID=A0A8J1MTV8_XENLA|nr:protein saal1 isoform X1 [Xenopus laevis]
MWCPLWLAGLSVWPFENHNKDSSPRLPGESGTMDRNPSPPSSDDEEAPEDDSIGDTVYSKHWFFSTLTRLIEEVSGGESSAEQETETAVDLDEELESEICKVWDMSMNQDVALFLQEFKAPEILLGIIVKSKCCRLTEICVGILGNMSCFQEPCLTISNNESLGEVALLLLSDPDPPTLLETSRLLLTCLSQAEVAGTWAERFRKHPSVRDNLCFIMYSSTNVDLLLKVGQLLDRLFDMDEDLMLSWIQRDFRESNSVTDNAEDTAAPLEMVPCLLEATKLLRSESPKGLDTYLHILHLLTTTQIGTQAIVQSPDGGEEMWEFLSDLTCNDLCQPNDPPLVVQEQKSLLSSVLAVLSTMFVSQEKQRQRRERSSLEPRSAGGAVVLKSYRKHCWLSQEGGALPLISSLSRVLENLEECQKKCSEDKAHESPDARQDDFYLQVVKDVSCEFLSNILSELSKDDILQGISLGHITEQRCLCALRNLLPLYSQSVSSFLVALGEADRTLADTLQRETSVLAE